MTRLDKSSQTTQATTSRASGTVKWWNNAEGFGFVIADNGTDAFVHYGDILGDGFKSLNEGDHIEFEMVASPRGSNVIKQHATAASNEAEAIGARILSLNTGRLRQVLKSAIDLCDGDVIAALEWLNAPLPALGGKSPQEMAQSSEKGAQIVMDLIGSIEYGIVA